MADAGDVPVKRVSQQVKLQAGESKTVRQRFAVRNPKLWSPDSPYLYRIQSRVKAGHEVLDGGVTRVGIRKAEFKGKDGFWLNGKPFGQLVGANVIRILHTWVMRCPTASNGGMPNACVMQDVPLSV